MSETATPAPEKKEDIITPLKKEDIITPLEPETPKEEVPVRPPPAPAAPVLKPEPLNPMRPKLDVTTGPGTRFHGSSGIAAVPPKEQ